MKNIVVGIDFSNLTQDVLKTATSLAKAYSANLHLVHVLEPVPAFSTYGMTPEELPVAGFYQKQALAAATRRLDHIAEEVRNAGVTFCSAKILDGLAVDALLDYVTSCKGDMLVVGCHGHGFLASFLLGSVAEGAIRKATVPTLIVPPSQPGV